MSHPSLPLAYGQNALAVISESRLSADDGIQVGAVTVRTILVVALSQLSASAIHSKAFFKTEPEIYDL